MRREKKVGGGGRGREGVRGIGTRHVVVGTCGRAGYSAIICGARPRW